MTEPAFYSVAANLSSKECLVYPQQAGVFHFPLDLAQDQNA